jgi:16S rRNA (guanine(966)-N(2))-methyltransferase RsmD
MRVIAGELRSRRLKTVPGLDTRPTPDRLRESLFNILAPRIEGLIFLDAYAGTGAVGIEALSRGAARAIFIERSRKAVEVLRENLASLSLTARADLIQGRVLHHLPNYRADIVFLDPPYELEGEYAEALNLLSGAPLVIAQHAARLRLAPAYGRFAHTRTVRHGDNALSFFEVNSP